MSLTTAAARYQINSDPSNPKSADTLNIQSNLFGSRHVGGCHFVMADGSVQFISENINLASYQTLAIKDDGFPQGGLQ